MADVNRRVRAVIRKHDSKDKFLVLLNKRAKPGKIVLMLPGGGLEGAESPVQALRRECVEELGLDPFKGGDTTGAKFVGKQDYVFPDGKGGENQVCLIFYSIVDFDGVPRNMEPEKVSVISWMSLDDCERLVDVRWDEGRCLYVPGPDAEENFAAQLGFFEMVRRSLGMTAPAVSMSPAQVCNPEPAAADSRAPLPYGEAEPKQAEE